MLYMTPQKFRVAGYGNDLSGIDDAELNAILVRSSAAVNGYCAAPTLPQPHDFRGGTIIGEQHTWVLGSELVPATRRYRPWHQPVDEVEAFRINVTEGQFIDIDPDDMFVNNSAGWVEIVALTLGVGVFPIVANLTMTTPVAEMDYTYTRRFTVTGERLVDTDGQTFRAENQFWLADPAPVVKKNGVIQTVDFTLDPIEGAVIFSSNLAVGDVVTLDYTYSLPPQIAEATGIIASAFLSEKALTMKGMAGLLEIQVNEVRLRRPMPTALLAREASTVLQVPPDAAIMLAPYVFRSVA